MNGRRHDGPGVDCAAVRGRIAELRRVVAACMSPDARVQAVVRHVEANPKWGLPELARAVGLSTCWLEHWFKSRTGVCLFNFILACRFLRAIDRLQATEVSVKHLAAELGYTRPANFTRSFHTHVGASPRWFRRSDARAPDDVHAGGARDAVPCTA